MKDKDCRHSQLLSHDCVKYIKYRDKRVSSNAGLVRCTVRTAPENAAVVQVFQFGRRIAQETNQNEK